VNHPILYVDDEPSNLIVLEAALEGFLPILTAPSGPAALDIMRKTEVAVLLTDQRMPGMSGVDLAEAVRLEFPDTIRMIVTAYSDLNAAIEAINRGQVHLFLRKPWDPREIRLSLEMARERYLMGRRIHEMEGRLVATERIYSLGVIAAGLAHEIRNPLSALQTNLHYVSSTLAALSAKLSDRSGIQATELADLEEPLADCERAAANILEITRSVELTSRQSDDGLVDLAEVVNLATRSIRSQIMRIGEVELQFEPVPAVRGSRTRLGQVVLNLVLNALESMDPARRRENRVVVRLYGNEKTQCLEVEDNGPGIPAKTLASIFDPFFTTKSNGGSGLGLAISRRIVVELGGDMHVKSEVGVGTRFTVSLPCA